MSFRPKGEILSDWDKARFLALLGMTVLELTVVETVMCPMKKSNQNWIAPHPGALCQATASGAVVIWLSRIDLSEWYGDIEVKAQDQIESEMEESIEDHCDKIEWKQTG